jgi:uncharacterized lipoprotein YddW (UPF0748 family)
VVPFLFINISLKRITMRRLIIFLYIILFYNMSFGQIGSSKYEFRGVWVATIGGIDWPKPNSRKSVDLQKYDLINMLDSFQNLGMNAIIFQVRPASDAFYQSAYEPWSVYLSGTQGLATVPFYDPLKFIIEESHKRNMELHAWFNPFRALVDSRKNPNPKNHFTWLHPEWCVNYGGKRYLDPGIPAARKYVKDVVMEVVRNYNIDAVHMDDYFYPYKVNRMEFPDGVSYNIYGRAFTDKSDWRRDNVNTFVKDLSLEIKKAKPALKFGISPFGIWRNIGKDPDGSNTNGSSNYDDLYADILLWLKSGWIDYVMPQLYWERGHRVADYTTLLEWWSRHSYNKHLYIGHGVYRVGTEKVAAWQSGYELEAQVNDLRLIKNVHGSCMYSANSIIRNNRNLKSNLYQVYNKLSIIPPMKWLDDIAPLEPNVIRNGNTVIINCTDNTCDRILVYSFRHNERKDFTASSSLQKVLRNSINLSFPLDANKIYYFTACDRMGNESKPVTFK